ncbi:hypothetical protein, partial [uncultured Marinobacter sp.]|uniref:hypothetical protein n=1 Tax=uncultured Marinobacter sp. TaxID=187379 RepID=UPI0030DAAEBB
MDIASPPLLKYPALLRGLAAFTVGKQRSLLMFSLYAPDIGHPKPDILNADLFLACWNSVDIPAPGAAVTLSEMGHPNPDTSVPTSRWQSLKTAHTKGYRETGLP